MHSLSVATVGTKGQIVIPLEIRDELNIQPGDKVVLLMRGKSAVVMLPMDGIQEWLDKLSADFDQIREVVSESQDNQQSKKED
ncbi:MAG TPA: AbrB/MazE/SpoVT family DNA-binding domain-containing protein [Candidatus Saccharimonadales bacterium]|nr:AbrB/MazE/SpoVT family DNA-binding domain-containing protein [Candidatus Saccharimonadales bacterium]